MPVQDGGTEIKMQNEIIEKAQELGRMIAESELKEKATTAADIMNNDAEATELLRVYNENIGKAAEALRGKKPSKEEIEEYKEYAQTEFEKLMENKLIKEYVEANKAFDSLVQQVNAVLAYFTSGQEQTEGGCTGSCATCGGCH